MAPQEFQQNRNPSPTSPRSTDVALPQARESYNALKDVLRDIPGVSASVQAKTGWDVDLDRVKFDVVSPQELSRRAGVDEARRTLSPSVESSMLRGETVGKFMAAIHDRAVIALYLPKEGSVLLNETLLATASKDAVRSALHHELTHVAQHQRHPQFMDGLDAEVRGYRRWSQHGGDFPRDEQERQAKQSLARVQARMSLLEAQANVLQEMYEKEFNLVPEVKVGLGHFVTGMTHRVIAGMRHSIGHYALGEEIFKRIHSTSIDEVNTLFRQPKLADVVFGNGKQAA